MPILYIHGVSVRDDSGFQAMKDYLRRIIAPAISSTPAQVLIQDVNWYPYGVKFAWGGISRPRTALLGHGAAADPKPAERALQTAAFAEALRGVAASSSAPAPGGGLTSGQAGQAAAPPVRLSDLPPEVQSDLIAIIIEQLKADKPERVADAITADELLRDSAFQTELAQKRTLDEELQLLSQKLQAKAAASSGLVGMGSSWWSDLTDRVGETLRRAGGAPAYGASVVLAETRPSLHDLLSLFVGDVIYYLQLRGTSAAPGDIPKTFLTALDAAWANKQARGNEPLIVISHSMGGQIVYDAVTHFLPQDPTRKQIKIDYWAAVASQVGFFEEAKLFLEKDMQYKTGKPVPFPSKNLGLWWNVWDHNDVLSFTAEKIIDKTDNESYSSGMSLIDAHSGYFARPSFYRRLAEKLTAAKAKGWAS